jgi:L-asparagine transporter-like permease
MLYLGGYGLSCGFSVGCGAGYFRSALRWLRWLVCCAVAYLSGFIVAFCLAWVSQFVLWVLMAFVVVLLVGAHTHTVTIDGLFPYLLL